MSGKDAPPRPGYYEALDGLRAVAVLMVFCQHYGAARAWIFGWGWTGVDIFFVLSGFLITGILYDSRERSHRFRDFHARRTLRIFPLYYAVWLAILLAAPVAQWQWDWRWALWPAYLGNYAARRRTERDRVAMLLWDYSGVGCLRLHWGLYSWSAKETAAYGDTG